MYFSSCEIIVIAICYSVLADLVYFSFQSKTVASSPWYATLCKRSGYPPVSFTMSRRFNSYWNMEFCHTLVLVLIYNHLRSNFENCTILITQTIIIQLTRSKSLLIDMICILKIRREKCSHIVPVHESVAFTVYTLKHQNCEEIILSLSY